MSARKVLVVAPAWVGDMVMSQVIYSALRADNPEVHIDLLAPAATLPLVSRMADVNGGMLIDQQHGQLGFGYRMQLGRHLQAHQYDQAIVTPNSLKSALVPVFAGIPRRTGFLGEYRYFLLNDIRLLDKKRLPLMTDRFLALVSKKGEEMIPPSLIVDKENQQVFIEKAGLKADGPIVGFCPGAEFGDAKKWPVEHYVSLAKSIIQKGGTVWIFGGPADAEVGEQITNEAGEGCINLAGKTSLLDAIDLLACCEQVVTNDSGLMHIAAAVGSRVVAIYGSTSPGFTPPISENAAIVRLDLPCSPCFKRQCPLGHKDCLNRLLPEQVLQVL